MAIPTNNLRIHSDLTKLTESDMEESIEEGGGFLGPGHPLNQRGAMRDTLKDSALNKKYTDSFLVSGSNLRGS